MSCVIRLVISRSGMISGVGRINPNDIQVAIERLPTQQIRIDIQIVTDTNPKPRDLYDTRDMTVASRVVAAYPDRDNMMPRDPYHR